MENELKSVEQLSQLLIAPEQLRKLLYNSGNES